MRKIEYTFYRRAVTFKCVGVCCTRQSLTGQMATDNGGTCVSVPAHGFNTRRSAATESCCSNGKCMLTKQLQKCNTCSDSLNGCHLGRMRLQ